MRFAWICFFILFFCVCGSDSAFGVSASLLAGDAARGQQWETVAVELMSPGSGGAVSIRDLRGGLTVSRLLPDAAPGLAVHVLVPLPLIAPAQLGGEGWPVEVVVTAWSGVVQRQTVVVSLPTATVGATFRVAVVGAEQGFPTGGISELPVTRVMVSQEELVSGPAMVFASCDAIVVPEAMLEKMGDERLAGLLAAGVHLIAESSSRPGALYAEGWSAMGAVGSGGGAFWRYASPELPALRVLEPGLEKVGLLSMPAEVGDGVRWGAVLVGPAALVVLFLLRGMFRNRLVMAGLLVVVMPGLALGFVAILRGAAGTSVHEVSWTTAFSTGSDFRLTERFKSVSAPFARGVEFEMEEPGVVSVVAVSPRRYFAIGDAVLSLDVPVENSLARVTRLRVSLADNAAITCVERSVGFSASASSGGNSLAAGYVSTPAGSVLFSEWAKGHAEMRDSLLAWYELRFSADHRYAVSAAKRTGSEAEKAGFAVTDFGPMELNRAMPTSALP